MSRIEEALEKAAQLRASVIVTKPSASGFRRIEQVPDFDGEPLALSSQLLVTATDPHTQAAEEYRKLKSAIVQLTKSAMFQNMLLVTSAIGSEGKSVTAANLALSLAQEFDHTVLLIDADLRKPTLHSYLGTENSPGLTDCLLDDLELKDALIRTGIGKLTFLPAGRSVSNPAELFTSQRVKDFFLEIKRRYRDRYIIIDTPPVLPFAETRSLSSIVDGIVLVAKEGLVTLHNLEEAVSCLKAGSMLGVVYNEAEPEFHPQRYQYCSEATA